MHTYIHCSTCELPLLPRTLKEYQDFLDLILTWHLLSRQKTADSLSYARQCIKEGQTVLMTKMSRQHSWKTSKNVFNFIICYHVRRSKGLAIYYLLHPSCQFIYVVFSNFITINTNQLSGSFITFVVVVIIVTTTTTTTTTTFVLIIIVIITLFFFTFNFSVSFIG